MDEKRTVKMSPEEELVDLLLEFIIVAASLAQKVGRAAKTKQNKEGGTVYGQGKRAGSGHQGFTHCGCFD